MVKDIRQLKLEKDCSDLLDLVERSDFIKIEPIYAQIGLAPEKYIVTFTCLGIAGVDENKAPQLSQFHQVLMCLPPDYPRNEPNLRWLSPIWHPNIEHQEPYHVCTNSIQSWWPGKSLSELVLFLGEMIQYKSYQAEWHFPYPLDREVAEWVIDFAEPNGIVKKDKPLDERPLVNKRGHLR